MKKFLFLIVMVLMVTGCGLSKEEIGKTVTTSIQEKFDNDKKIKKYNLKVKDIEILKKTKNEYSGFVSVYLKQEKYLISVDINIDGEDIMWKIENGALFFLCQEEIGKLFN